MFDGMPSRCSCRRCPAGHLGMSAIAVAGPTGCRRGSGRWPSCRASPRRTARPKTLISRPDTRPMPPPAATATAMAAGIGRCCEGQARARCPVNPATDPTDRSMPPVRMTNVMPTDTMPITTDWSSTLKTFDRVRKIGGQERQAPSAASGPPARPCGSSSRRVSALASDSLPAPPCMRGVVDIEGANLSGSSAVRPPACRRAAG